MVWSFSRLNGFSTGCKYCWFQNYAQRRKDSINNAFAEYGLMMHEILEGLDGGKLMLWDTLPIFEKEFVKIKPFPYNKWVDLRERYYEQGITYLSNYKIDDRYEVISVEENVNVNIKGYKFTGYIDKLIRDKMDNKLIVLDHKSKSEFKSAKEQMEYARQLYLYAYAVHELYGEYPKMLSFNMFRFGREVNVEFREDEMNEAIQWMVDVIHEIKECNEFAVTKDKFFGEELCNFREDEDHKVGNYKTLDDWEPKLKEKDIIEKED